MEHTEPIIIYSDSQATLKALRKADPTSAQDIFKQIFLACESLATRGREVRFQWIPAHRGTEGNEAADKRAKEMAEMIGPLNKAPIRYLSAVSSLLKGPSKASWDSRWNSGEKGRFTFRLTPQPSLATRRLYAGLSKGQSAILAQLRTGKIGFNAFLYERWVPTVLSPCCACDLGAMTVYHILLTCPTWTTLRSRYLAKLETSDIRKILNSTEGSKAAVQFTLATNLLPQFQRVACEEQETRRGNN